MIRDVLRDSGKSPYNCTKCGKKFSKKSYLEKHVITHSGHKQLQYGVRDLKFSRTLELNVHSRIHKVGKEFESVAKKCLRKYKFTNSYPYAYWSETFLM